MAVGCAVAIPVAYNVLYGENAHPLLHVGNFLKPLYVVRVAGIVDPFDQGEQVVHLVGRAVIGPWRPTEAVVPGLDFIGVLLTTQHGRVRLVLVGSSAVGVGHLLPHLDLE